MRRFVLGGDTRSAHTKMSRDLEWEATSKREATPDKRRPRVDGVLQKIGGPRRVATLDQQRPQESRIRESGICVRVDSVQGRNQCQSQIGVFESLNFILN